MPFKDHFIAATEEYNTFEKPIPAYYFRRKFATSEKTLKITVAVCGFYELYFNGRRITKGFLSPYISNPDDYVYYDEYEVTAEEENVIAVLLGNGFQNDPGGYIWDFDKASFRSAPSFALQITNTDGAPILVSDEHFRTFPSPIRSDDYRFGEYYDANCEVNGWNEKDLDDSDWSYAIKARPPKGELRKANVRPIVKECEISPVNIIKTDGGFIYDFGISNAGICRLKINGEKGQSVILRHADNLKNGDLDLEQIWFKRDLWDRDKEIIHRDTYVCKGEKDETYEPTFTYHGFRYVKVEGVNEKQATTDLLTFLVYHTELNEKGDFSCSDPVATKLQEITRRSILSNFHHLPTDCPQREKNGWTADAALSCEAALLNFDPEINYREWILNVCKAQSESGSLPGIVPTGGWGFHWGNGPAWDCVLAYLPYYTYVYRGTTEMISDTANAMIKYIRYLRSRCDENGLLEIGLGDWCHVGGIKPKAPLILTDTVMAMDIANKAAETFSAVGMKVEEIFARGEAAKYRSTVRSNLINKETAIAKGECQSSQAMCLYYGVFDENERQNAFTRLLGMIDAADEHMDVGVLGGRVIFHVLSEFGRSDLAFKMITREDYPSYGNWLKRGATTLWEKFLPNEDNTSMNHHFWGDISAWFIRCIAGIRLNPTLHDVNALELKPSFIDALDSAKAYHDAPAGRISVSWNRTSSGIDLTLEIPDGVHATAKLEEGYFFEDGTSVREIHRGQYTILKRP